MSTGFRMMIETIALLVVVLVSLLQCTSAAVAASSSSLAACPILSTREAVYGGTNDTCTTCSAEYCQCIGSTYTGGALSSFSTVCTSQASTCELAISCARATINCLNDEADKHFQALSCLQGLHLEMLSFNGTYSGSSLERACHGAACNLLNASVQTGCEAYLNVPGTLSQVCVTPAAKEFIFVLSGDFSALNSVQRKRAVVAGATPTEKLKDAIQSDLTNHFGFPVFVTVFSVNGGGATATVHFYYDPSSVPSGITEADIANSILGISSSSAWMVSTKAQALLLGIPVGSLAAGSVQDVSDGTAAPEGSGRDDAECGDACIVGIVMAVLLVVGIIATCVIAATRKMDDDDEEDEKAKSADDTSATEPIAVEMPPVATNEPAGQQV